MSRSRILSGALAVLLSAGAVSAQLGSRPAEAWTKTLDDTARVASLRIDDVVAAMRLQRGDTVADIGAGSGLFEVALGKAVGSNGKIYAVDIDAGFFPKIRKRARDAGLQNIQTVLGKFTDPGLPVRTVNVAFFHDVLHHIQDRAAYLETVVGYLAPSGRVVVVDFDGAQGPHKDAPELQVSRPDLSRWTAAAGLTMSEDIKLFADKFVLVYKKTPGAAPRNP